MTHISGHDHPPDQECRFPCPATEVGPDGKIRLKNALPRERQTRGEKDISGSDPISPMHYRVHPSGIECITIAEHFPFNLGNVIKYVWRHEGKNGLEDLRKARQYLDFEITRREREQRA